MSEENKALVSTFNKGITLENKIIERAKKTADDIKNPFIKELILGIAFDSEKHANLLQSLIDLIESKTPYLSEEERDTIGKDVNDHILMEREAIVTYQGLADKVSKREMKLILNYLVEDEKRHHELLKKIQNWIVESQTFSEEEWWDLMWKDTLFHGSPMG